eukprot:CAMPEP_0113238846 /NCGR_PEP_ID=MMETSP0008_2-20120614/5383_1 /TAXON_ID=97485 /ORGANISM="Prymnesium parvum" /LENGTH=34 /DNA_ID=CAMNT_0000086019 /DNA_START=942 /DNA_END=1046 /DNA_ORIENTATION=+ /assembly_acc=CAM_ASM_000153
MSGVESRPQAPEKLCSTLPALHAAHLLRDRAEGI